MGYTVDGLFSGESFRRKCFLERDFLPGTINPSFPVWISPLTPPWWSQS